MPATTPTRKARKDDEYRWRNTTYRRKREWQKWERVGLKATQGLDDLKLQWVNPNVSGLDILGATSAITLERTIEGASTFTIVVKDPDRHIFSSAQGRMGPKPLTPAERRAKKKGKRKPIQVDEGWEPMATPNLYGRAAEVDLDGMRFRLVKVTYSYANQEATLTFEDLIIYLLKRKRGERRVSRNKATRAQFVLSQLREVKLVKPPFICPELMVKQPIDKPASTSNTSTKTTSGGSGGEAGFSPNAKLEGMDHTGARYPITGDKVRNATEVMRAADEMTDNHLARLSLVEACNIENKWSNSAVHADADSEGILQARRGMHGAKATDIHWCVERFLKGHPNWRGNHGGAGAIELAKANPGRSAGWIAQEIQGSGFPDRYDKTKKAANEILRAWGGAGGSSEGSASKGGSYSKSYQYARQKNESAYTSIMRLAQEVAWRFFPVGMAVYYMSEEQLFNRRIRYTFRPDDNAVLDLTFDVDWGKPVSECTLQVTLEGRDNDFNRWGAPPGCVVELEGWDVPDGRWLVASVRRDWFSPVLELSLRQPGKAGLEPASEKTTRGSGTTESGATDPDAAGKSGKLYQIVKEGWTNSYLLGGGHGPPLKDMNRNDKLDCSSSTSLALFMAGMWDSQSTARVSGSFNTWGEPGQGERATVWYNGGHVFTHFEGDLKGRFDTGGHPNVSGPRYVDSHRSTSGFQARHWPGT